MGETIVVKIGGSTLGAHDTTLDDVAELARRGVRCVVVHGGGAVVSEWLKQAGLTPRFERGLRVTDGRTLDVVAAVLGGLVNKQLVAALAARGVVAAGVSGADGAILRARIADPALGYVGEITGVERGLLDRLLGDGVVPVVAPLAAEWEDGRATGRLLNTNADMAAGALAAALGAGWLVFLTDVPGVRDGGGAVLERLSADEAVKLIEAGVIDGGMIPKVEACLAAARAGARAAIVDGRQEHALLGALEAGAAGTVVG